MKSECDFSLDSYMKLARSSRLNLPIEQTNNSVSPNAQTSSLKASKTFSLGCLINLKNSGEEYSTVVKSMSALLSLTCTASQKSQSRYLLCCTRMFQGLMSRCAMPQRCSWVRIVSICWMKSRIYCTVKRFTCFLRKVTYSCRFISYFCMNNSNVLLSFISSLSFYQVLTRELGCHPNCERKEQTPITLAKFSLLIPFNLASTSKVAALCGTSLTTN